RATRNSVSATSTDLRYHPSVMRSRSWLILAALLAPRSALAQQGSRMVSADPASSQPATAIVYLDGSGAPAAFATKVDERLRAMLVEKGVTIADLAQSAAPES